MSRRRQERPPRLEMLPLIDVMFLLLAVFIYSMITMVRSYVLPVDLPRFAAGEQAQLPAVLVISVERDGSLWIGGKAVGMVELAHRMESLRDGEEKVQVLVNADESARHGDVMRVFDCIRSAGLERVLIVGRPEDAASPL